MHVRARCLTILRSLSVKPQPLGGRPITLPGVVVKEEKVCVCVCGVQVFESTYSQMMCVIFICLNKRERQLKANNREGGCPATEPTASVEQLGIQKVCRHFLLFQGEVHSCTGGA